jgi:TIR domain
VAYVGNCKNDVFVSYATADNQPDPVGACWVDLFVQHFRIELGRRLGGPDDLAVYFDKRDLGGNDPLPVLLENARSSAVFIAVLSPAYVARDWTREELTAFTSSNPTPGRVFVIEILPVDEIDRIPPEIAQLHRMPFFWRNELVSKVAYTITPNSPNELYMHCLQDLTEQVRSQMRDMHDTPQGPVYTEVKPTLQGEQKAVLLARTTHDLTDDRDQVRRYLEQFGVKILPELTYADDGNKFASAFTADLKRSKLFVQLLGPTLSIHLQDLPTTFAQFQYHAAKAAGLKTLLWRRPDLDITGIKHEDCSLLVQPDIIATGLEFFKSETLRLARPPQAPEQPIPTEPFVFINADATDVDFAAELQREFVLHECAAATPAREGLAVQIDQDLADNIVQSDGIVLVYGKAEYTWVRGQLRLYNRLKSQRKTPPRFVAIYLCPPERKPSINMALPEWREIDCRTQFTLQPVKGIVAEMRR